MSSTDAKLTDIANAVVNQLKSSCTECGSETVDNHFFLVCNPKSPSFVTYRARLKGTSKTDSGSLVTVVEEWVRDGATVIVSGILMRVDSDCSVTVSDLDEGECSSTSTTNTDITHFFKPPLIAGSVAVAVFLTLTITFMIIMFKSHCCGFLQKKTDKKYANLC